MPTLCSWDISIAVGISRISSSGKPLRAGPDIMDRLLCRIKPTIRAFGCFVCSFSLHPTNYVVTLLLPHQKPPPAARGFLPKRLFHPPPFLYIPTTPVAYTTRDWPANPRIPLPYAVVPLRVRDIARHFSVPAPPTPPTLHYRLRYTPALPTFLPSASQRSRTPAVPPLHPPALLPQPFLQPCGCHLAGRDRFLRYTADIRG